MGRVMPALRTLIRLTLLSAVLGAPVGDVIIHSQDDLLNCNPSQNYSNLASFGFNPRVVPPADTACLSFKMYKDMGFIQQFTIPTKKLSRFIHHAQKGYRNVPYHNWTHGFAVLHFAYAVLKNCMSIGNNCFTQLEGLALLTAAMTHDLDHPGTNSRYQELANTAMAQAYKNQGSILERHHIEKTFRLLQAPETNFVAQLKPSDHRQFMDLVSEIILATDLTSHFKVLPEEQKMARERFNGANEQHRTLLRSVVISSADLSDQTKDWMTARRSSKLVTTEFFDQGDNEKKMGLEPEKMMDRNRANIAEVQKNFISHVVMPLFRVLLTVCPETQGSFNNMERNLKNWERAVPYFEQESKKGRNQLEILSDIQLA